MNKINVTETEKLIINDSRSIFLTQRSFRHAPPPTSLSLGDSAYGALVYAPKPSESKPMEHQSKA